jgi:hypothetical protein
MKNILSSKLFFIIFCICLLLEGCNTLKKGQLVYWVDGDKVVTPARVGIDMVIQGVEIKGDNMIFKIVNMPFSAKIFKSPIRKNLKNEKVWFVFHNLAKQTGLSNEDCSRQSGWLELTEIDLKNKVISGSFEIKVCYLKEPNNPKIFKAKFNKLEIKFLCPDLRDNPCY